MNSTEEMSINEQDLNNLCLLVEQNLFDEFQSHFEKLVNSTEYLTTLIEHGNNKFNLLMLACFHGNEQIVKYLLQFPSANEQIAQRGNLIFNGSRQIQGGNVLYCSCFQGHFHLAKYLIEFNENLLDEDTFDDQSYPLLLKATIENRLDIVRFLLENRYSHVNETRSSNNEQRTALMCAAYYNHSTIAEYLINHGADVHYTNPRTRLIKTPLTCAVISEASEVFRVLWKANAGPKSKDNDLLKLIVHRHAYDIMMFLLEESFYSPDDLEDCTASRISDLSANFQRIQKLLPFLEISLKQRQVIGLKKVLRTPRSIFDYHQECQTIEELKNIENDHERILIECLLIQERLYLPNRRTIFKDALEEYTKRLISAGKFEQTFDVCLYFIEIDQGESSLFLFIWILCRMISSQEKISIERFLQAASFALQPSYNQSRETDVNNALFFVVIANRILEQEDLNLKQRKLIYRWIIDLCRLQSTCNYGQTMLHLCVHRKTSKNLTFRPSDTTPIIRFPNRSTLKLLLTYGNSWLDINRKDQFGDTPLHIACQGIVDEEILEILIKSGSHLDCVNQKNQTPFDYLTILRPISKAKQLKCLCAQKFHFITL
ncbi:unnamed protein product [Adineta ricciae]|uniref:Uncharacterized protein n=1 Tax=Adineta ricciae TaxID=249248 RepID=A0A815NKQ4_ADIRI|nr:unnamed protein product [Adineta ricciae]CAF1656090.1 unnamed protein product [Adineta ricciae]